MQSFNIYLCGVGGQGIGLLCEILLRAADYAGYTAKAVDTHGLAQRGGMLAHLDRAGLIEGLHTEHFMSAMDDLMAGRMLQTNMEMFRQMRQAA
jgi:indolepyruvate ferredoxin oxidoreductase, beta subunit